MPERAYTTPICYKTLGNCLGRTLPKVAVWRV